MKFRGTAFEATATSSMRVDYDDRSVRFTIHVKTVATGNLRVCNSRIAGIMQRKREAATRDAARAATLRALSLAGVHPADLVPCVVTMTRVSAGLLDRHDGPQAALKRVVDGIALALGLDDGGPFCEWRYQQRRGKRGVYGVEVRIDKKETPRGRITRGVSQVGEENTT